MSRDSAAARRVGLLVVVALFLAGATLFVLGDRQNLFTRQDKYRIRFANVGGLAQGSMVQLNGVHVGSVDRIWLPADTGEKLLEVRISIEARYAQRIRGDSQARIKTLGLLGDKYLEITSGSPAAEQIPPGGEIPAAPATDVDRLAETGEDVVNNIAKIAHQLTGILGRLEAGEGLLGRLLVDDETGDEMGGEIQATLTAVRKAAESVEQGEGTFGRLVHDRALADQLASAVGRLDAVLAEAQDGEGALPALLSDAETKRRLDSVLASLEVASQRLAHVAEKLDSGETDALLAKLIEDEEYGRKISGELAALLTNLREVAEKLNKGDGSAARLINDPQFAIALENVVIGVNESKLLSWLIKNQQEKGIEKRYQDAREDAAEPAPPPSPN
jgi:phospholipid/cholesterol/gamma-HCH transport system substrate-binding protein